MLYRLLPYADALCFSHVEAEGTLLSGVFGHAGNLLIGATLDSFDNYYGWAANEKTKAPAMEFLRQLREIQGDDSKLTIVSSDAVLSSEQSLLIRPGDEKELRGEGLANYRLKYKGDLSVGGFTFCGDILAAALWYGPAKLHFVQNRLYIISGGFHGFSEVEYR